jgi:hypothetical protein
LRLHTGSAGEGDAVFDPEFEEVVEWRHLMVARCAMDVVSLFEKEVGEIRSILPGDADDQCSFGHGFDIK